MPRLLATLCCLFLLLPLTAQNLDLEGEYGVDWGGYLWGIKGGPNLSNQDWSGLETEFALGYHGAIFLESVPAGGRFSIFGQLGYHLRGSKISRRRGFSFGGNQVTLPADGFQFRNISLGIGAKSVFSYTRNADLYYLLGVRGEYSIGNNLSEYDQLEGTTNISFRANYPIDSPTFINEITYGVMFGAGAIMPLSDNIGGFVEIRANPDLNFQYNQGPIPNVIDPFGAGTRTIPARMIRNFTIEVSVGFRFLRSYRYVN